MLQALLSARAITANFAINAFFMTCLFPVTQIQPRGAGFHPPKWWQLPCQSEGSPTNSTPVFSTRTVDGTGGLLSKLGISGCPQPRAVVFSPQEHTSLI